jgi:predicted metalloprotease with PDZ domain
MPKWMPGYYQIMDYAKAVQSISSKNSEGKKLTVTLVNENRWQVVVTKNKPFRLNYDVKTEKQFVANNYVDGNHGYIAPCGAFLYINGYIHSPVSINVELINPWSKIATGLDQVNGKPNEFTAPDFDMLYDCPILAGNLPELPSFKVNGTEHRFIAYHPNDFDKLQLMANLKKIVEAAVAIMGDIPYRKYTFIGIGPGRGGIEHLNNTTVGFDGKGLNTAEGLNRTMTCLAHEYFHHYNVKSIRPLELGPFDYDNSTRTNLRWVSEALSVYYEYLLVKRAGLINEQKLLGNFVKNINGFESSRAGFINH